MVERILFIVLISLPYVILYQKVMILNLNIIIFQQPILEEPRISLPESFGACVKAPAVVNVTLHDDNVRDPTAWSVKWYIVNDWSWQRRTLINQDSAILRLPHPTLQQTGQRYEVDVRNPFGLARGLSRVIVTEGNEILLYTAHNFLFSHPVLVQVMNGCYLTINAYNFQLLGFVIKCKKSSSLFFIRCIFNLHVFYITMRKLYVHPNTITDLFENASVLCVLLPGGGGGGDSKKKLGRGVRPASQNPYPIYDQNLRFSLPYL